MNPLAFFAGLMTAVALIALYLTLFTRRSTKRGPDGGPINQETNPLMQLFTPLITRRGGYASPEGQAKLALRLHHAGEPMTPDAWQLFKLALPFGLGIGLFSLGMLIGNPGLAMIFGLLGAVVGILYPNAMLNGRMAARTMAVRRDVPVFLETLSVFVGAGLTVAQAIEEMSKISNRYRPTARGATLSADQRQVVKPNTTAALRGPLWREIRTLALAPGGNLFRRDADTADSRPDPLQQFAINANTPELTDFIRDLREALRSGLPPAQQTRQIRERAHYLREEHRYWLKEQVPKRQRNATGALVVFNMPILWVVTMGPSIMLLVSG